MDNDQNKPNAPLDISTANKNKMVFALSEEAGEKLEKAGYSGATGPLMYALEQATGSAGPKKAPALAFTENPNNGENYAALYKTKRRLIPDNVLKDIRTNDHLIAAILRARGAMMSLFGNLQKDRFDIGVEVKIKDDFQKILTSDQYAKVIARMKRFEQLLLNCGHTEGLEHQDRKTLAEFLDIQTRNGCTFGRFATEIVYDRNGQPDKNGNYPFFRFRPIDVSTIVRAVRKGESAGNGLRITAMKALEALTGEKLNIDLESLKEDKYAWLQVIDGTPKQAFTHEEMLVFDLYPSTDIEHNGYPVTPIDTVISSITTHLSIDAYKKLYFQNGRASKGMLVIQSDEIDQQTLDNMKLQFNASINSVSNSFRTPIFGIGKEDKVDWLPMTGEGARDTDFAFMYDQIARNILSAFSMSPDELPGYGHLSKASNSQVLSESSNEYKLTAARDTGLRPLVLKLQTFFNQRLLPIMDPLLAKICEVRFAGLDAQSKEQENARLQQDMAIHMSYDEVLHQVDKDKIGKVFGGELPFNERYQIILDKFMDVGAVKSHFFNDAGAIVDPLLKYKRDPFYLQWIQLLLQTNPAAAKALFAPKPYSIDFLRMNIQDSIEED